MKKEEENRYLIQLSIKLNSPLFNCWDYVESKSTLEECLTLCEGLFDKSVHKLQIADIKKNRIIKTWT